MLMINGKDRLRGRRNNSTRCRDDTLVHPGGKLVSVTHLRTVLVHAKPATFGMEVSDELSWT